MTAGRYITPPDAAAVHDRGGGTRSLRPASKASHGRHDCLQPTAALVMGHRIKPCQHPTRSRHLGKHSLRGCPPRKWGVVATTNSVQTHGTSTIPGPQHAATGGSRPFIEPERARRRPRNPEPVGIRRYRGVAWSVTTPSPPNQRGTRGRITAQRAENFRGAASSGRGACVGGEPCCPRALPA